MNPVPLVDFDQESSEPAIDVDTHCVGRPVFGRPGATNQWTLAVQPTSGAATLTPSPRRQRLRAPGAPFRTAE